MKLRAKEEPRLESERQALIVEEEQAKKLPTTPSYLRPLNKRVNEKSLAEPPPRLLLLNNLKASGYNSARLEGGAGARSAPKGNSKTENVPGYMKTINRSTAGRFGRSHHSSARGRAQSANQVARRRSKSRSRRAWGSARNTVRASSSSQRRLGRGRSMSATRRRGGAGRSWIGHLHVSKSRRSNSSKGRSARGSKTSRSYTGGRRSNNTSPSVSPRRPILWPTMSTLPHVAQPSRLKLRG